MAAMKRESSVFPDNWRRFYPCVTHGEGIYLFDSSGKRYLDATGGFHVVTIGHGLAEIADAMHAQARKVAFVTARTFTTEIKEELARTIIAKAPGGMSRVYFTTGGSVSNEFALQIAREYHVERGKPTKYRVVGRWQSYHGCTVGAASMTGHVRHRERMAPYLLDFPHTVAPYCYRCPFNVQYPQCHTKCADELALVIEQENPNSIAAFIAEPVIGTTGSAIVPPPGYYERIRDICDYYDVLFIADEVVTAFGRTGRNFGIEHWDAEPDLITCSKTLTAGYAPLGAVLVHERIWQTFMKSQRDSLSLRLTFSGHPVSCAAGLAVQEYIDKNNLTAGSDQMGMYLKAQLDELAQRCAIIGDVRGRGLLLGVEFVETRNTEALFNGSAPFSRKVVEAAIERGLLLVAGTSTASDLSGGHISISPPFVITEAECDTMVMLLEASVEDALSDSSARC